MLPSAIKTIRELILWGYARLMSEKVLGDRKNWLFTLHSFEQLNFDGKKWSGVLKENIKTAPDKCAYCGSEEDLLIACIVPKKMCPFAETHNIISACKKCASSKGSKDLIEWWGIERIDELPLPVMDSYLKMLYMCHECNGTLDEYAVDNDGKVGVSALACVFKESCDPKKAQAWHQLYAKEVRE